MIDPEKEVTPIGANPPQPVLLRENGVGVKKNVFIVGFLSFFGGISQDIFAPILPIYLTTVLGFDKTIIGIAEGIVSASSYLFKIVSGYLSDKKGVRMAFFSSIF